MFSGPEEKGTKKEEELASASSFREAEICQTPTRIGFKAWNVATLTGLAFLGTVRIGESFISTTAAIHLRVELGCSRHHQPNTLRRLCSNGKLVFVIVLHGKPSGSSVTPSGNQQVADTTTPPPS
jgi:hypothetical protein